MVSYFVYIVVRTVMGCIRILPRCIGIFLLKAMALAAYSLSRRHRHIAAVNLKIAFPDLTVSQRKKIARGSFQNTAMNLLEISRIPLLNRQNISSLVQYDPVFGMENFMSLHEECNPPPYVPASIYEAPMRQ